jgi:DNA-binding FadR family transcriptional regulator
MNSSEPIDTDTDASADDNLIKILSPEKKRHSVPSVVRTAASQMRDMILAKDEGQFLGSEEELITWLGVSRPTFRQVARLLEYEQLLLIKKGPGGGFFSRKPSLDAVVHLASICLVSRKGRVSHMLQAGAPLYIEAARLAAAHPDLNERKRLQKMIDSVDHNFIIGNRGAFVRLVDDLSSLVFELSRNPVMEMFINIVREFAAELQADSGITTVHMKAYIEVMTYLVQAIVAGDVEVAGLMASRINATTRRWSPIELPEGG